MKVGFIDYFLDEWHANNYPKWIADASNGKMAVTGAYGMKPSPSGMTSEAWCTAQGVRHYENIEAIVQDSDAMIVLSPDHPQMHWELCQLPLRSGKPVYVDKAFSCGEAQARALFDLAKAYSTPVFSSSALRFSDELLALKSEGIQSIVSVGPGQMENYLIHQIEPIVAAFASPLQAISYIGIDDAPMFALDFGEGKRAFLSMMGSKSPCPFFSCIRYHDGNIITTQDASNYFHNFITVLVQFFETRTAPVDEWQTIEVMRILEKAQEAKNAPDQWLFPGCG